MALLELGEHVASLVGGDRERRPGAEPGDDAHHATVGAEQRAAGAGRLDRGVGLQHVVDQVAAGGLDAAAGGRHAAGAGGGAVPGRVAHGHHLVARHDRRRVAELERPQVEPVGRHLQHGEVRALVLADHLGRRTQAVLEDDVYVGHAADDVGIRQHAAVLVEHEPGPCGERQLAAGLGREGAGAGLHGVRAHVHDAGCGEVVDLGRGHGLALAEIDQALLAGDRTRSAAARRDHPSGDRAAQQGRNHRHCELRALHERLRVAVQR